MIALLLAALAWGEPPAKPAEDALAVPDGGVQPEPADIEVTVYGEMLVERARQQVVDNLVEQGFVREKKKGNKTIFRHESPWRGQVVLYDDGWMKVKRQPVRVEGIEVPWAERNSPLAWASCVIYPFLCVRPGGQLVSGRKFQAYETRTVQRTQGDVDVWGDRIADLAVANTVNELPPRLEALWYDGRPLDGEGYLDTPRARRAALLSYWGSRTDTPWGEAVRQAVEAFILGVVQGSDHPFTDDEIRAFNAQSPAGRPFTLRRGAPDRSPAG